VVTGCDLDVYGIPGIDREIHQDLLQLSPVGENGPKFVIFHHHHLDILAKDSFQHSCRVFDNLAEIDDAGASKTPHRFQSLGLLQLP
jgi:hypothetical protein